LAFSTGIHWNIKSLYKARNGISGPKPHLIFGNLFDIKGMSSLKQKQYLIGKYGKIVGLYYGCRPAVQVVDPELCKHIQVKHFQYFVDRPHSLSAVFHPAMKGSIQLSRGQRWKDIRSVQTPAFSTSKLKQMFKSIDGSIDTFLDILAKKQQQNISDTNNNNTNDFNIYAMFELLAADIIGRTCFGYETNVQTMTADNKYHLSNARPSPKWLRYVGYCFPSMSPLVNKFCDLVDLIKHRLNLQPTGRLLDMSQDFMDFKLRSNSNQKRKDLLQLMLDTVNSQTGIDRNYSKNKQSISLSESEIRANCGFNYLAGSRTTGSTLGFVAHILVNHPDVQERVRQEVRELYETDGRLDYNTVTKLEYMECVINETMRLYPSSIDFAARETIADYKYSNNITIPKGTAIQFATYYMHRDPDYWPEPEKFDPERFSSGGSRRHEWHPYAWQPFGSGPRNCPGVRLAYFMMKLCLAKLLINYRLEPGPRTELGDIDLETKIILMFPKNGVFVKVVKI
ncbi:cytochrome P450 3A24-like, partial [Oppia nitens]|uniref:cytochrome P450 3A24-like n=1 Tax=Oppia nitens TaxID=1686743 RepID=UPI0023DB1165